MTNERKQLLLARWAWQRVLAGDARGGAAALRLASASLPSRADVLGAFGIALAKDHRSEEAIETLARSLAIDATAIDLWCALGELALNLQRFDLAAHALGRCLGLDGEAAHPAGIRARALIKRAEKLTKGACS